MYKVRNKNNNKKKRIIIIAIILIIVLLVVVINTLKKKSSYAYDENGNLSKRAYKDICVCLNDYICSIKETSDYFSAEKIYNILSENYIKENNITKSNVTTKVRTLSENIVFTPIKITVLQDKKNISSFLVYGVLGKLIDYSKYMDLFMVVNINSKENTYSIEPIYDYANFDEIKVKNLDKEVINHKDNVFTNYEITDETIATDCLNAYKKIVLTYPEVIYNRLSKNQKKFKSLEDFKKYVNNNRSIIITLKLEKYKYYENTNQYECEDQHGNKYIFTLNDPLNFEISYKNLDIY